jgi:hypothetical protein
MCSLSINSWFRHFATRVHVEHTLTSADCCGVRQERAQTCSATKWTPRALVMVTVVTIVWTSRIWSAMMSEFCSHLSMSPLFFVVVSLFYWSVNYVRNLFCHKGSNQLLQAVLFFLKKMFSGTLSLTQENRHFIVQIGKDKCSQWTKLPRTCITSYYTAHNNWFSGNSNILKFVLSHVRFTKYLGVRVPLRPPRKKALVTG